MRRNIAVILALMASLGLAAVSAPAARADGDPASDVLSFRSVFDPPDYSGATGLEEARLQATVAAATKAGYPIKVALVASRADLGAVTYLWENPLTYSGYLGKELSLVFHGAVLVVMPEGYGLYVPFAPTKIPPGDRQAMGNLVPPGSDLAGGALSVVQHLAADNHVTLPTNLAVVTPPSVSGGSLAVVPLVGFIVGLGLIAGAWGLSLRARPLRRGAVA